MLLESLQLWVNENHAMSEYVFFGSLFLASNVHYRTSNGAICRGMESLSLYIIPRPNQWQVSSLDHDAVRLCPAFPNSSPSSCNLFFSRLQGRSTALSLWFKIAVNLTKWQFINPAKLGRLYFQPEGTLFRRIKFHYNEGKIICTPPPSPCHLSLSPNRFSHLDFFLTRPPINRVSHSQI